jgi:hypothetical protein
LHLLADTNELGVETIGMNNVFLRERRGAHLFLGGLAISGNLAMVGMGKFNKRSMRKDSL